MKTELKGLPLIIGMAFIVFTGCKKEETFLTGKIQSSEASIDNGKASNTGKTNKPIPVTITMAITGGSFPNLTGPITTTG